MRIPLSSTTRVLVSAGLLVLGGLSFARAVVRKANTGAQSTTVPGEILVRFKRAAAMGLGAGEIRREAHRLAGVPSSVMALHQKFGTTDLRRVLTAAPNTANRPGRSPAERWARRENRAPDSLKGRGPDFRDRLERTVVLRFDPAIPLDDVLAAYRKDSSIEVAEPHRLCRAFFTPTDPRYGDVWGLTKIDAPQAWDIATGSGIVVAVVDTGVDHTHPDLATRLWTNTGETPANSVDDDGNGFVDDIRGWDFAYGDANPSDVFGHGTHVSGTIAAEVNNAEGIVGVAFDSRVMALKGLDDFGDGTSSSLANAILYAVDNGADVINASWGGYGSDSAIASAVSYAQSHGVVFVAAAGNETEDVAGLFPANLPGVIAVAATDSADDIAYFSNYGNKLSLSAPGVSILSCLTGGGYIYEDGTSMAAPHVSGVAALLLSYWPLYTAAQVKSTLTQNVDDLGTPGFDSTFGYGRLNAFKVLNAVLDISSPTAPTNLTAVPLSSSRVRLRWGAATDDRGVRGYGITRDGVFLSTVTALVYDDSGRTPDTDYVYSVTAVDQKDKVSPAATQLAHTPIANPNEGTVTAVPFPNPAPPGQDPTLRLWMEFMDRLEISIYDVSGTLVHRTALSGEPSGFVNGAPYHDYHWTEPKATGTYQMMAVGERNGTSFRARSRFTVVR